ncbi:MAG: alpha-amylase family glycosyl hydrolase [Bryobacteraceae bacterium]
MATLKPPVEAANLQQQTELRLHLKEPDYGRPLLRIGPDDKQKILEKLTILYGPEKAESCYLEVERVMQVYFAHKTPAMIADDKSFDPRERFTEKDVVAITYGDLFQNPDKPPLKTLADIVNVLLHGSINTLHLLPFFPYSSDRGFSVIDYREVDPNLGTWDDIEELSLRFKLMFDGVINHISSKSDWFQEFLNGNPEYQDFFVTFSTKEAISEDHLRLILRPRTSNLLTRFRTLRGEKFVWTTFSPDQIDLNYTNEKVLLRVLEVLLFYIRRGADIIRLDAATYLWRELGTTCAHLQETHALIQLFRAIVDVVAPRVALLTETNVPHEDNISYFGDGTNEAHMVYNFSLPPLVLRAMRTGNCRRLSEWASRLERPSDMATYFNFLDSHDGIGLLGVRHILNDDEIQDMVRRTLANGGMVSYRTDSNGNRSPYEQNITWYDALNKPGSTDPIDLQVNRFVASRALALVLVGVPAIYLPSIGGSQFEYPPLPAGAEPRSINRRVIQEDELFVKLNNPESAAGKVAARFKRLIDKRIQTPAFHPNGRQQVLMDNDSVFSVIRESPDRRQLVLALTNVTEQPQKYRCQWDQIGMTCCSWRDILSGQTVVIGSEDGFLDLAPYQTLWLTPA